MRQWRRLAVLGLALVTACASEGDPEGPGGRASAGLGEDGPDAPVIASMQVAAVVPGAIRATLAVTVGLPGRGADPDTVSWTVDWGDGVAPESLRPGVGARQIIHRYGDRASCGPTGYCRITVTVCNTRGHCASRFGDVPIGPPQVTGDEAYCDFVCRGRWGWQRQALAHVVTSCDVCDQRIDDVCEGRGTSRHVCDPIDGQIVTRDPNDDEPPSLELDAPPDGAVFCAGDHDIALVIDTTEGADIAAQVTAARAIHEAYPDERYAVWTQGAGGAFETTLRDDPVAIDGALDAVAMQVAQGAPSPDEGAAEILDELLGSRARREAAPLAVFFSDRALVFPPEVEARAQGAAVALIAGAPSPEELRLRDAALLATATASDNGELLGVAFRSGDVTRFDDLPPFSFGRPLPREATLTPLDLLAEAIDANGNRTRESRSYTVLPQLHAPFIAQVEPSLGAPGDAITLSGRFFSPLPANNVVHIGAGMTVSLTSTKASLTFTVPVDAEDGALFIEADGEASNVVEFRFDCDGDGIPDNDERDGGTDPKDPDSDDDGVGDGEDDCPGTMPERDGNYHVDARGCPLCDNGVQDGNETDVDCGGVCAGCPLGAPCGNDDDCASNACVDGRCRQAHCRSGALDGDESDVDCGGSCERCDIGDDCRAPSDCATGLCSAGQCRQPSSCLELLLGDPTLSDGVYEIVDPAGGTIDVYCDMSTDDGGWTLIAASAVEPPRDERGDYHEELRQPWPTEAHAGVWDGLASAVGPRADLRFACKAALADAAATVDLSFYGTVWYPEVATGTDAESCFNEADGAGYDRPAPRRRNNLADAEQARGTDWGAGFLEGEDSCDDVLDFTVDFDDRGVDGDPRDGTDWGSEDGQARCGAVGIAGGEGAWTVWVREFRPDCADDARGGDETDVDCGGSCRPCAEGQSCGEDADCDAGACVNGTCVGTPCSDGVLGDDESDVDCGGSCPPCDPGAECDEDADCLSQHCDAGVCADITCDDGRRNGDEGDVDCGGSVCERCPDGADCAVAGDCRSGVCLNGRCEAPACDDGVANGDESDVDCGGSCAGCEDGERCLGNADCDSGLCVQGVCRPERCANGGLDSGESDVDCGGDCAPCPPGDRCEVPGDCDTGYCPRGLCEVAPSCLSIALHDPQAPDGVYPLRPDVAGPVRVNYCDMSTDGGGWTLVASSAFGTLDDRAGPHHEGLSSPTPTVAAPRVWDGMRAVTQGAPGDLRFTCRQSLTDAAPAVDLSFYDVDWYDIITTGSDADSCFNVLGTPEAEGPAPARRNNLSGDALALGSPWRTGQLVGESRCDDPGDFTVDFDDAGMDGDERDGTDWGEDDGVPKCGDAAAPQGSWSLWLREEPLGCADGEQNGDETGVDCGGSCEPCPVDVVCVVDADCASLACVDGVCVPARCDDGRHNGNESDRDCGGDCPPCPTGGECRFGSDCESLSCVAGTCVPPSCLDGLRNGGEADVDCGEVCVPCPNDASCNVDGDCRSGACIAGRCVPEPCENGQQDLAESDVDCGGPRCERCRGGEGCGSDDDCETRECDGGVCKTVRTCLDVLRNDASAPSGVYALVQEDDVSVEDVYCDMESDGGGWTLVAASTGTPLNDEASPWYADLATLRPAGANAGVWSGLRDLTDDAARSDLRFTCRKDPADADMAVDLSFYAVDWYRTVTSGTDADSCFNEFNGAGFERPAPRRRDNLSGAERPRGDDWQHGFLEGEDVCEDTADFTVDFDNRGMDTDQRDGTDWGEDDDSPKCGDAVAPDGSWFVWFREAAPSCFDGVLGGDETAVDCGGSCPGCPEGVSCGEDADCRVRICRGGVCAAETCANGVLDGNESDVDCGGDCGGCPEGGGCNGDADCESNACQAGVCAAPRCDDGRLNGHETGVDCGGRDCGVCPDGERCRAAVDCESGVCEGERCAVPTCVDGVHNGSESDVDCGGVCAPCADGFSCNNAQDCAGGVCQRGLCVPGSCVDSVWNGSESDVDCGGSCAGCPLDRSCADGSDCESAFCVEERCGLPRSCADVARSDPGALDGVFTLQPPGSEAVEAACDMRIDEGAWTLVASSAGESMSDLAADWHDALTTLFPDEVGPGVWDGLRPLIGGEGVDMRFVCRADGRDLKADVDLSFYDVDWYETVTTGTDADSCFAARDIPDSSGRPPARRDNVTGRALSVDTPWQDGRRIGEDDCGDVNDFSVDLQDIGIDGDEGDGTDWGLDDGISKCGFINPEDGVWQLWVRDLRRDCSNGRRDPDESGVDCGGPRCAGCAADVSCRDASDCLSRRCVGGVCLPPTCEDGIRNGNERSVDCGGECPRCTDGERCRSSDECESGVCFAGVCQEPRCDDGVRNADESDEDCGPGCAPCALGDSCSEAAHCASNTCIDAACRAAHCVSGALDGDETDVDCGGASCLPCAGAQQCAGNRDCRSRQCDAGQCRIAPSCLDLLLFDPTSPSGVYPIRPPGAAQELDVYCDMSTDGGGWTVVAASAVQPLRDARGGYHDELAAESVQGEHADVWDGMRAQMGPFSDVRFTCRRDLQDASPTVDLSFYRVDWYRRITAGSDLQTCFVERDGDGYDRPAPRRRNNRTGEERARGVDWSSGLLEGEDECDDTSDFSVDFDDRGIGGDPADGTDWGEADTTPKCGDGVAPNGAWRIWVRETRLDCLDGAVGGDESDLDCGGSCLPCAPGGDCGDDSDCAPGVCDLNKCRPPACADGVQGPGETDVDCGGACEACTAGEGCAASTDCESGVCTAGSCAAPACDDGLLNGGESATDCGGADCPGCADGDPCGLGSDCASGTCELGRCVAVSCATTSSCPGALLGDPCLASSDCASAYCHFGVCERPATCRQIAEADPTAPNGIYALAPDPAGGSVPVRCDMRVDGGGWTLVSSTAGAPVDDRAVAWHPGLVTLSPEGPTLGVWDGLRAAVAPLGADLRFTCRSDRLDAERSVDLSFYGVEWYSEIISGEDVDSCFAVRDADSFEAPARRNNLNGDVRARNVPWREGALVGEDSCGDLGDFTVDFDDAGMDGNERDGTDWGEDDGIPKCGDDFTDTGAWLIWVRELRPDCADAEGGPGETGVDCGGGCPPCPELAPCEVDADCQSGACVANTCAAPTCEDGRRNGDERGVDCGGSCAGCPDGAACDLHTECASQVCAAGSCQPSRCDDGLQGGDESDVDCGGSCDACGGGLACRAGDDCLSNDCASGRCLPVHCTDGVAGNSESDRDCGGPCRPCTVGQACAGASDCASGRCSAGICAAARSCFELRSANPSLPSGPYTLADGRVYCDMDTDGGGWTLVASSRGEALKDTRGEHHAQLATLSPQAAQTGVWDGLRALVPARSDLRFSCKADATQTEMTVDLSFYDVDWYREVTTGSDAESCFNEADGAGYDTPAPARRNNVNGDTRPAGDDWDAGYLEGEDSCADPSDFTVDFDDRGMDGDANDGTDWGEDDGDAKCGGLNPPDGAWFLWVRE